MWKLEITFKTLEKHILGYACFEKQLYKNLKYFKEKYALGIDLLVFTRFENITDIKDLICTKNNYDLKVHLKYGAGR